MENQVAVNEELLFDPKHLTAATIKKYLCPKASDQELMMGLQIAKTFGLNPLKREVYFVKYKDDQPMQVLTGYEVYLKRAERSGKYNGLEITSEGNVEDGTLKAKVKVFRKDWDNPLTHEAYYTEYVQMKKDFNSGKLEPNTFWKNKPVTMIKKVAVSQAFRLAFPCEFDGMPYTSDEAIDQEKVVDVHSSHESAPDVPQNAQKGHPTQALHPDLDPNEQVITKEQGSAILYALNKNGYSKDDLKEYITWEFQLDGLKDIKNKHVNAIKEHFAKPKVKVEA